MAAKPDVQPFAGRWAADHDGRPVVRLDLRMDAGTLSGSIQFADIHRTRSGGLRRLGSTARRPRVPPQTTPAPSRALPSYYLVRSFKVFNAWLLIPTAGVETITLVTALSGVDVAKCLVILMLAPVVTVVESEVRVADKSSP